MNDCPFFLFESHLVKFTQALESTKALEKPKAFKRNR